MSKILEKNTPDPEKIRPIQFLVLDVDGVMTDGTIVYTSSGEEIKAFNVKDGAGLKYWTRAGHKAAFITGRESAIVERRASELDIAYLAMNVKAKLPVFENVLEKFNLQPHEVAVMGDDLMELPMMRRAGLAIAVADAMTDVKDNADWVTQHNGGKGAVREIIDHILKIQGKWDTIMSRYLI